ncbi:hypothetical protein C2845_PM02G36660 [Panicum miliaceum]|uniref:Uncharacterized protein n=1 Tax=Panicum miliaceum TaxID=4540 RepID=A0A3L6S483_PANMI|nr:hypothetical protein C2845_PM02G36660 [Panicum miliaceum]
MTAAANGERDETSGLATPLNHELAQGAYGNASFVCQRKSSLVTQRLPKAVCMGPCHSLRIFTEHDEAADLTAHEHVLEGCVLPPSLALLVPPSKSEAREHTDGATAKSTSLRRASVKKPATDGRGLRVEERFGFLVS